MRLFGRRRETQRSIVRWGSRTFHLPVQPSEADRMIGRALEEFAELLETRGFGGYGVQALSGVASCLKTGLGRDPALFALLEDGAGGEMADVVIFLFRAAGCLGFDLLAEVDRKMKVNRGRRWERAEDGSWVKI